MFPASALTSTVYIHNVAAVCRERRQWNKNKGGRSAHNQVRLNNRLLEKLLLQKTCKALFKLYGCV